MMTTFLPVVANVMARLVETNVFPAWGFDEVTIMTFISPLPRFMKFMFERIMRKTSDTGSRPFSRTTKLPCCFSPEYCGISPGTEPKGCPRCPSSPDRGVEYLDQVDDQEGDAQSEQEGDSRNQHGIGRHGARGTVCTVDRARVAFRDDHGDGVLLAFVEQVEVKFLLDFLLTDDVQNLFFLRRYRGYSLIGQRLFLS